MSSSEADGGEDLRIPDLRPTEGTNRHWPLFGTRVPKTEIVFFCQVIVLYTVIVWSSYNLTTKDNNATLWTSLLSSCLGYLLPSPSMKRDDF